MESSKDFSRLRQICDASIRANLHPLSAGKFLTAGSNQFKSLWTRDFCYAARGLLALGETDVVRRQLGMMLDRIREDGLVPRCMTSASHFERNYKYLLRRPISFREPLRCEYDSAALEGLAIDSNALTLLAVLLYVEKTGDQAFWNRYLPTLMRAYRYYDQHLDAANGLVNQGDFADWQDSVKRSGQTFYVNVLYHAVSERLRVHPEFKVDASVHQRRRQTMIRAFRDPVTGLYLSIAGHPRHISLDGNLLAIDVGFHPADSPEARELWGALKRHPLWQSRDLPGFNTIERYPLEWIGLLPRLVNVADYHDDMYWSWLMGLSAKVATLMDDLGERDRVLTGLENLAVRDDAITEVFEPREPHLPVHRVINFPVLSWFGFKLYRAEAPFSWGAGMILDALVTSQPS